MAYDYEWFKTAVLQMTKIDLNAYKERCDRLRQICTAFKDGQGEV